MLTVLRVQNLAIVDRVQVNFGPGLNVVTGETGAGKSIIVNSLGLVLGGRADRAMIRAGAKQCSVEACFELEDAGDINAILDEIGLDPCENNQLIVRRIIAASGSGKNLINDCPTTAQTLKRIGNLLIDLHGPHDHQSLLDPDFQLDILDAYGHLAELRAAYTRDYRRMLDLHHERSSLDGNDMDTAQQIDMLSFQVKELEEANLDELDENELINEHTQTANASRIIELIDAVRSAILEDDASAFNALAFARRSLPELAELMENASEWVDEVESVSIQLQELANTMAGYAQSIDSDPEKLLQLEERMALIQKLKRKYGNTIPEMIDFLKTARERLHKLESRGERLAKIDAEIAAATKTVNKSGSKLHKAREKCAAELSSAITNHLHDLGFAHGEFRIELSDAANPRPNGLDEIDFGFAPNLGEPMRSLKAIASSGEISRVMLATKAVLAKHDRIPVLVFDEIDSNVGGEMGNAIGSKLAAVAQNHQVLCITHLPQVAVHGQTHFVVAKEIIDERTRTSIAQVSGLERAEEVARMLGGKNLTSLTLQHAQEMLKLKPDS